MFVYGGLLNGVPIDDGEILAAAAKWSKRIQGLSGTAKGNPEDNL